MTRQELFLNVLPRWERRIQSVSFQTIATKPLPNYLGTDDLANRLRLAVWHAVVSWDEERGMALDSWIFHCINQGKGLFIEEYYPKVPRSKEGVPILLTSLNAMVDIDDDIVQAQFEDVAALDKIKELSERESFEVSMQKIRLILPNEFHQTVFDMILSEEYKSDQAIADELKVDFARVCDVRHRMKVAFAVLNNIPISTFTRAQNAARMAEEMKRKLKNL